MKKSGVVWTAVVLAFIVALASMHTLQGRPALENTPDPMPTLLQDHMYNPSGGVGHHSPDGDYKVFTFGPMAYTWAVLLNTRTGETWISRYMTADTKDALSQWNNWKKMVRETAATPDPRTPGPQKQTPSKPGGDKLPDPQPTTTPDDRFWIYAFGGGERHWAMLVNTRTGESWLCRFLNIHTKDGLHRWEQWKPMGRPEK